MKSAMKKMEEESSLLKMTIEKCEIEVSGLQGSLPDSRSYISGSQTTVPQVYLYLIFIRLQRLLETYLLQKFNIYCFGIDSVKEQFL